MFCDWYLFSGFFCAVSFSKQYFSIFNNGKADAWDTNGDAKPDQFDDDGDGKPDVGR